MIVETIHLQDNGSTDNVCLSTLNSFCLILLIICHRLLDFQRNSWRIGKYGLLIYLLTSRLVLMQTAMENTKSPPIPQSKRDADH